MKRIVAVVLLLAALAGAYYLWQGFASPSPAATSHYVGSQACTGCHQKQADAWLQSDHHRAMEPANEQTVLGNFDNSEFDYFGRKTVFSKKDGHYQVSTENQQGSREEFTIAYTLGYRPLQQYLVKFPDGRIQTLPFAWDTRSKQQGGQRWFHLYPVENVTPDNPLFWTRPLQNWNYMCADCHTTNFAKNFSDKTNMFSSHWTENGNGCESCHGPGSAHIELMKKGNALSANHDLMIKTMHTQTEQMNNCGVCHARRTRLQENPAHEAMWQTWQPEFLQQGLYFDDGRMRDEVFNVGSFMQSKMYAAGVTCSNCHEPHSAKVKIKDDGLCLQCHTPERYSAKLHHPDPTITADNRCVSCHMPARTYMVVDVRHDHYFSVPHPDGFAKTFWLARHEQQAAEASLAGLIQDDTQRAMVRATALLEMGRYITPDNLALVEKQLASADPALRLAATQSLAALPPAQRAPLLLKMLDDSARAVRLTAAPLILDIDSNTLDDASRKSRDKVFAEYRSWLEADSDRGNALVNLAGFVLAQGDVAGAHALFEKAITRDSHSLSVLLNYADFQRSQGDDVAAEKLLQTALAIYPDSADAHYAWGLLRVRQHQYADALQSLRKARNLAPENSQFAYVYAVGLYAGDNKAEALAELASAHRRFPANGQVLGALQAYCAEQSQTGNLAGSMQQYCRFQ